MNRAIPTSAIMLISFDIEGNSTLYTSGNGADLLIHYTVGQATR